MDLLHDLLPWRAFPESLSIVLTLYGILVALGLAARELPALIVDYATPIVIFGIGSLVYLETVVSDRIRTTAVELWNVARFDSSLSLKLIFNLKLRFALGIASVLACGIAFFGLPVQNLLWYQSSILRVYVSAVVLVLVFIGGEAVTGAIAVVLACHRIAMALSKELKQLTFEHFGLLRMIAMWGVWLSVYGSLVASVLLVGVFVAPWRTGAVNVQIATLVLLSISSVVMVYLFLGPVLSIHSMLKRSKQQNYFLISGNIETICERIAALCSNEDPSKTQIEADAIAKILADIETARTIASSAPEWPWDLPMIHSFTIALGLPIVIYYIERLLAPSPIIK